MALSKGSENEVVLLYSDFQQPCSSGCRDTLCGMIGECVRAKGTRLKRIIGERATLKEFHRFVEARK